MTPLSHAQHAVEKYPAKITADEFKKMISENPSVFEHWNTPLEITEYVNCENSEITHLSKHLTFSGKNDIGYSANFWDCKNLKVATGTFQGTVIFANAGIQKIENLQVTQTKKQGLSASFGACKALEIASGNFEGAVDFDDSGIHSIQNLHVHSPNQSKIYASFLGCANLKTLESWDLSKHIEIEPEKLQAEIKRRAALKKFIQETQPLPLPI
jgi:hypothetical protein